MLGVAGRVGWLAGCCHGFLRPGSLLAFALCVKGNSSTIFGGPEGG